jgi:RNA polymerase sigma-70 factor (ECF subfamily)
MNEQERHDQFTQLITSYQSDLYAYIFAIVRDWDDASDLYQSVCLVLWRKFESFQPGSSFISWARQTAKFEVRHFLTRKKPISSVTEELLIALAGANFDAQHERPNIYLTSLQHCRKKLEVADEELLALRYVENLSSSQIADRLQRPQQSVCNSLKRIRRWLLECIEAEITRWERSGSQHS